MKRTRTMLALAVAVAAAVPWSVSAADRQERKLVKAETELDEDSKTPENGQRVEEWLEAKFKVDDARIDSLRSQKLGFGEITIVLALAQKLPGGITDANVQKVLALRNGPPTMGWDRVAKSLNLKLGAVVSEVREADRARRERAEKGGRDHDRDRDRDRDHDRMGKSDDMRPEKPERFERPETPGDKR